MEGELTCKNCSEKYNYENVPHTLPCGHSLCTICLQEVSGKESECMTCECFIENIKINKKLAEEIHALETEQQEMAESYFRNTRSERILTANKRTNVALIGNQGIPVIEMTSYKFSKGTKVKESYYLASLEVECGRNDRDEVASDSPGLVEEKEKGIIRDKLVSTGGDRAESKQAAFDKPSNVTYCPQNVSASTMQAEESTKKRERKPLVTETFAGSCSIHEYPNTAYCVTCSVMVCKECLITFHNDTSGKCEITSVYQMIEKFIAECNAYVNEDIELTKDLKLNMTGITLYLHKEGNAISEKITNLKEELKCLEESLKENNAMKSEVQNKETHLTEWITAIQFYKKAFINLHLSSTSATEMKEIVNNRDGIQEQLTEHTIFVEEFKQKHPKFSFDIVHVTDFNNGSDGECDGHITDSVVVILNDDKPEYDIKQQFSTLLSSHDSSHSSLDICTAVEQDDQSASNSTAGELINNKLEKPFTQILGFFPDMSATSTPLPETFGRASKETASKETAYFSNTTDSQKSEDMLNFIDTNPMVLSYKQEHSTVYGSQNKKEHKVEVESPSTLLTKTLVYIPTPSLAESFQELAIDVPVEIRTESDERELLNTEKYLTASLNPSDQEVMQISPKASKQETSGTNGSDDLLCTNPYFSPKTSQRKSKKKKKLKSKSRSKYKRSVSETDPKQMTELSIVSTHEEPSKKNKSANNPIGENSKTEGETQAAIKTKVADYSFDADLEQNFILPRPKLLDAVQNKHSASDFEQKVSDSTEDQGFEEHSGKSQICQEYGATSSKYFYPSSKISDMKELSTSQDSIPEIKSKFASKIKTEASLDILSNIMEKCLIITPYESGTSESVKHEYPSKQNPSQPTRHASYESLSKTQTQHMTHREGAIPKRSTRTGTGINEGKISSDSIGLFPTPLLTSEATNRDDFISIQDTILSSTKSLTPNPSEESVKKLASSSEPTVISVEPGSEIIQTFLQQCLTEAMGKTKGFLKYLEDIRAFEKEWLTEGGFHEKSETFQDDDMLSDSEDSSKDQSPSREISCLPNANESTAPGTSKKSTKEHLKEIALQISSVFSVDSPEASTKRLSFEASSDPSTENVVSEHLIEGNRVQSLPSAQLMDEKTYEVFKKGTQEAAKIARKQAKRIVKAGSLDSSLITPITQALITVASKHSRIAAATIQHSSANAATEEPERRQKRQSRRQKMRQEAMRTYKTD